jgi:hypothetical protein
MLLISSYSKITIECIIHQRTLHCEITPFWNFPDEYIPTSSCNLYLFEGNVRQSIFLKVGQTYVNIAAFRLRIKQNKKKYIQIVYYNLVIQNNINFLKITCLGFFFTKAFIVNNIIEFDC